MTSREAKLQRLNTFRRKVPHVSASALSKILSARQDIPELSSRQDIADATASVLETETPHGQLLTTIAVKSAKPDAPDIVLDVVNPLALMWYAFKTCSAFAICLNQAINAMGDEPLGLFLYSDEITPGRELAHTNLRKSWLIYFTFQQFGHLIHLEEAWLPLASIRSDLVSSCAAGISQIFAACMKLFFGACGADLEATGMSLISGAGERCRLFLKLAGTIQDGGAHKYVFHCTGDSGSKFCILCRNLYSVKSNIVDEEGENLLTMDKIYEEDLDFATDDDIYGSVDRLAARKAAGISATQFRLRQQAAGFRHEPNGILLDMELRGILQPASQFIHDWMHAMCSSGVCNILVFLFLMDLSAFDPKVYNSVHDFINTWWLPAKYAKRTSIAGLFTKERRTANNKAKTFNS